MSGAEWDFTDNSAEFIAELERKTATALEEIGLKAEAFAVAVVTREKRVDTGRYRGSITHRVKSSENAVYIGSRQLPVFKFINGVLFSRRAFWLRSVVSSTSFDHCYHRGNGNYYGASRELFARPLILFG